MEIYFNQIRIRYFLDEMLNCMRMAQSIYDELEGIFARLDYLVWQHGNLLDKRKALENDLTSLILVFRRHINYLEETGNLYFTTDRGLLKDIQKRLIGLEKAASYYGAKIPGEVSAKGVSSLPETRSVPTTLSVGRYALPNSVLNEYVKWSSAELNTLPKSLAHSGGEPLIMQTHNTNSSNLNFTAVFGNEVFPKDNAQYASEIIRRIDPRFIRETEVLKEADVVERLRHQGAEYGWFQMEADDAWEMSREGYPMILTWSGFVGIATSGSENKSYTRIENGKPKNLLFILQEYEGRDMRLYIHQ